MRKYISLILCVLLMICLCSCREDAILTYPSETEYFPLVDIDLGISKQEVRNALKGRRVQSFEEMGYDALAVYETHRKYGGSLIEKYYFNKDDELVCMLANIDLMAPAGYYRNDDKMEEFVSVAVENAKEVFERLISETGLTFNKNADDITVHTFDESFRTEYIDSEKEVFVKINMGFVPVDSMDKTAGMSGSFRYCFIDYLIKPAGVTTEFDIAYQ